LRIASETGIVKLLLRIGSVREENLVLFDFPQSYWSRIQFCANNQHPENQ
jgi:hypothetical protein